MASEAYGNVERAMDASREAELAAYIMRDVELRQQNAQENGVLAYGKRPVPRSVPNQRFLQNTLKNLDFANRSAREKEMWQQWDAQNRPAEEQEGRHREKRAKARKEKKKKKRKRDDSLSEGSWDHGASDASQDELEEMLSRRPARGRGSTGARADETGPFLFPTDQQEREEYELMRYARKQAQGPNCPSWIRGQIAAEKSLDSDSERDELQADRSTKRVKQKRKDKSAKKSKSSKKEHKGRKRKET